MKYQNLFSWRNKKRKEKHFNMYGLLKFFPRKQDLTVHAKLSPICMKYQNLFSVKNKKKYFNVRSAKILTNMASVKIFHYNLFITRFVITRFWI